MKVSNKIDQIIEKLDKDDEKDGTNKENKKGNEEEIDDKKLEG